MNAKKIRQIWLGIIIAATNWTAYCGDRTIANKEFGFEITFPESWKVIDNPHTKAAVEGLRHLVPGGDSVAFVGVYVGKASKEKELKDIVAKMYVDIPNPPKDYKVIKMEEAKIGDIGIFKITFIFSNDGLALQHTDHVFLNNNLLFVIKCSAKHVDYEAFSKDINNIVQSFKLTSENKSRDAVPK